LRLPNPDNATRYDDLLPDIPPLSPEFWSSPRLTPVDVRVEKHQAGSSDKDAAAGAKCGSSQVPAGPGNIRRCLSPGKVEMECSGRAGIVGPREVGQEVGAAVEQSREGASLAAAVSKDLVSSERQFVCSGRDSPCPERCGESELHASGTALSVQPKIGKDQQLKLEDTFKRGGDPETLQVVLSRVEELGKQMEQMLARCVLVETRVKLAGLQQTEQLPTVAGPEPGTAGHEGDSSRSAEPSTPTRALEAGGTRDNSDPCLSGGSLVDVSCDLSGESSTNLLAAPDTPSAVSTTRSSVPNLVARVIT